jgi:hypothetical protein
VSTDQLAIDVWSRTSPVLTSILRLRALAHRDKHRQHAVVEVGRDLLGVDALPVAELAQVRTVRTLLAEPLRITPRADSALGADREQLALDIDIDGARVDTRHVRIGHVLIAVPVEVHGHEPQSLTGGVEFPPLSHRPAMTAKCRCGQRRMSGEFFEVSFESLRKNSAGGGAHCAKP